MDVGVKAHPGLHPGYEAALAQPVGVCKAAGRHRKESTRSSERHSGAPAGACLRLCAARWWCTIVELS